MYSPIFVHYLIYFSLKGAFSMRLLVVDDEKDFVSALKEILTANRYTVEVAYDGRMALDFLENEKFDCLLLDIMMPKVDGYEVVKTIRKNNDHTPVIFLSAKNDVDDKIKGLDLGGDDYLSKPFSAKELLARLKAILRRRDGLTDNCELRFGDLVLNGDDFSLSSEKGKENLSAKEYQIMELFFRHPERVIPAEKILKEAWEMDSYQDISSVWVYISNLRKKIQGLKCNVELASTRGLGYHLELKNV